MTATRNYRTEAIELIGPYKGGSKKAYAAKVIAVVERLQRDNAEAAPCHCAASRNPNAECLCAEWEALTAKAVTVSARTEWRDLADLTVGDQVYVGQDTLNGVVHTITAINGTTITTEVRNAGSFMYGPIDSLVVLLRADQAPAERGWNSSDGER